jgi:diguanylate cyclase (GGDEF)-like protein
MMVKITLCAVVAEIFIMLLFSALPMPDLNATGYALADGLTLGVIIAPAIYYLLIIPLQKQTIREQKIRLVLHDSLTGLPRRGLLTEMIKHEISVAERGACCLGLIVIFPDGLSEIYQTLGLSIGNRVVEQFAARLKSTARKSDYVSCLRSDKFAVLLPRTDIRQMKVMEERIRNEVSKPFQIDEACVNISSISGMAVFPNHANHADDLINRASMALDRARTEKIHRSLFNKQDVSNAQRRIEVFGLLRNAIRSGQLELFYQPKINLDSEKVSGVEALVRWVGDHGRPPSEFIPLAEQTGLIGEITCWVIEHAVRQCRQWRQQGLQIPVSVNVSAHNLYHFNLEGLLIQTCGKESLPVSMITVEVTESAVMQYPEVAIGVLTRLKKAGFSISLDDFGTGYSSLAYLKNIPVAELKLDRSFITNIVNDRNDRILVQSVIHMARELGLATVAEGVETEDVLEKLRLFGCESVQGYYFSRPLDADSFIEWHRRRQSNPQAC